MNEVRQESLKHVWETLFHTPYPENIKVYVLDVEPFKKVYEETHKKEYKVNEENELCFGFVIPDKNGYTIYLRKTDDFKECVSVPRCILYLIHELIHVFLNEIKNSELLGRVE